MKTSNIMKNIITPATVASILALVAAPAFAVDYYLAAKAYTKTMPDGSTVPMWGYVVDTDGTCYNGADNLRMGCINDTLPDPTSASPGPRIIDRHQQDR